MKNTDKISKLIKEEKRKYYQNWRKNNKDKIKKINERYWKNRVLKNQK